MRSMSFWLLGCLLLASCSQAVPGPTAIPEPLPAPTTEAAAAEAEYALVWQDEFDGSEIDLTKWTHHTGGTGFGNNELQYYSDSPINSFVEDGLLIIEARDERTMGREYSSAKLWTLGKADWQYGRIEIRAQMPVGQGIWPAFWMLPRKNTYGSWPHSGEIDIMEYLGHQPEVVHASLHFSDADLDHQFTTQAYRLAEGNFHEAFHVFAVEWEAEEIRWFVDGEETAVMTRWSSGDELYPAPFDHSFYLILNLAVGGNWPGNPDETTEFPQRLLVDYVRVYQQVE